MQSYCTLLRRGIVMLKCLISFFTTFRIVISKIPNAFVGTFNNAFPMLLADNFRTTPEREGHNKLKKNNNKRRKEMQTCGGDLFGGGRSGLA